MPSLLAAAAPDGGILSWINGKTGQLSTTLIIVAGALAVLFAIWYVIKSGFRFPAILMAALSAGFFLWVVNNPDFVANLFTNEIESAPATLQQQVTETVSESSTWL